MYKNEKMNILIEDGLLYQLLYYLHYFYKNEKMIILIGYGLLYQLLYYLHYMYKNEKMNQNETQCNSAF